MNIKKIYQDVKNGIIEPLTCGIDDDGNDVIIDGITNTDELKISTLQSNGWVRLNYYDKDGNCTGEIYSPCN